MPDEPAPRVADGQRLIALRERAAREGAASSRARPACGKVAFMPARRRSVAGPLNVSHLRYKARLRPLLTKLTFVDYSFLAVHRVFDAVLVA